MHRLAIAGFLLVLSVSGCAWMKGTATGEAPRAAQVPVPPNSAPQSTRPPASTPPSENGSSTDNGSDQSSTPAKASDAAPPPPPPPSTPVSPASRASPAKAKSSGDTLPAKQAGAAAAQTRPPVSSPVASPTLNLADLEQRLRETRAIGVFTKLS